MGKIRSLARAARSKGEAGEPLPQPIEAIRSLGFVQRKGQLSLLVAGPGTGKSAVALYMVLRANIPCLYISADTDRNDQSERAMALLAGVNLAEVRADTEKYLPVLSSIPKTVGFEFESEPDIDDLDEMTKAYRMVHGFFPDLIVVDTIGKIWSDVGDEVARNKEAVKYCQDLARITGAHVMGLHHAVKSMDSGDKPVSLDMVMSGVTKIPEQILSMWRSGGTSMAFSPIKNRSGPSDATAMNLRAFADMSIERMTIKPIRPVSHDFDSDPELM